MLPIGTKAVLQGIASASKKHLNGQECTVLEWIADMGRYLVDVPTETERLRVLPEKLRLPAGGEPQEKWGVSLNSSS